MRYRSAYLYVYTFVVFRSNFDFKTHIKRAYNVRLIIYQLAIDGLLEKKENINRIDRLYTRVYTEIGKLLEMLGLLLLLLYRLITYLLFLRVNKYTFVRGVCYKNVFN